MNTVIRPATPDDAAAIRALVVALAEYERLPPPDDAAQARLLADAFRPQPRVEIAVAEVAGAVVGYAFFFETYSTFLARPTLYLEDLFVLPAQRGTGVGKALMIYLAREAARRECGRMEWAVLDWNETALAFYRHLGAQHLHDWQVYRLDRAALAGFAE